jgi:hypothetical protein
MMTEERRSRVSLSMSPVHYLRPLSLPYFHIFPFLRRIPAPFLRSPLTQQIEISGFLLRELNPNLWFGGAGRGDSATLARFGK